MPEIFHIAERTAWEAARTTGAPYTVSTRGRTLDEEGFVHCSADLAQAAAVLDRFYADAADLVLLVIDTDLLDVPVRYEPADGDVFPHVYGPIPPSAVIDVRVPPGTR